MKLFDIGMRAVFIALCVVYSAVNVQGNNDGSNEDYDDDRTRKEDSADALEISNEKGGDLYHKDMMAGDIGDLAGVNKHRYVPREFKDFARRLDIERDNALDRAAEETLNMAVQLAQNGNDAKEGADEALIPVKANPEEVWAIAKKAQLDNFMPVNPSDAVVQANILRSGNYWDSVWKEVIPDPSKLLRSRSQKKSRLHRKPGRDKLETVRVKVVPGSKLYKLVALIKRISPTLLYIINNK